MSKQIADKLMGRLTAAEQDQVAREAGVDPQKQIDAIAALKGTTSNRLTYETLKETNPVIAARFGEVHPDAFDDAHYGKK